MERKDLDTRKMSIHMFMYKFFIFVIMINLINIIYCMLKGFINVKAIEYEIGCIVIWLGGYFSDKKNT